MTQMGRIKADLKVFEEAGSGSNRFKKIRVICAIRG